MDIEIGNNSINDIHEEIVEIREVVNKYNEFIKTINKNSEHEFYIEDITFNEIKSISELIENRKKLYRVKNHYTISKEELVNKLNIMKKQKKIESNSECDVYKLYIDLTKKYNKNNFLLHLDRHSSYKSIFGPFLEKKINEQLVEKDIEKEIFIEKKVGIFSDFNEEINKANREFNKRVYTNSNFDKIYALNKEVKEYLFGLSYQEVEKYSINRLKELKVQISDIFSSGYIKKNFYSEFNKDDEESLNNSLNKCFDVLNSLDKEKKEKIMDYFYENKISESQYIKLKKKDIERQLKIFMSKVNYSGFFSTKALMEAAQSLDILCRLRNINDKKLAEEYSCKLKRIKSAEYVIFSVLYIFEINKINDEISKLDKYICYLEKEITFIDDIIERIEVIKNSKEILNLWQEKNWDYKPVSKFREEIILGVCKFTLSDIFSSEVDEEKQIEVLEGNYDFEVPLVSDIGNGINMTMIDSENFTYINNVIFNIISQLPPGDINATLIDTKYAGQYFSEFIHLKEINKNIVGNKILTNKIEIQQYLEELVAEVDRITQLKLGDKYNNIVSYNTHNISTKVPLRLVAILGFPEQFDKKMLQNLYYIIKNGGRCGINFIFGFEYLPSYESLPSYKSFNEEDILVRNIYFEDNVYNNSLYKYDMKSSKMIQRINYKQTSKEILKMIANKMNEEEKSSLNLKSIINSDKKYDSSENLIIPIGINEKGNIENLVLGVGTSHHGLIAGQTGSGKSTLLHTIITSAINNYSPEELNIYLLDFKEGIEFKSYAKYRLPHIKLIALESQLEFGESILEFMVNELKLRGQLFKELEVDNLKSYKEKTGKNIPRILLIIDEFTILFNKNEGRDVAYNNAQLMKRIINQGRAFGINVLMASQTIKDTMDCTLANDVIEQMAVRIGLKCSPKDAMALMGNDNKELINLGSEMGMAIYNSENGRGDNSKFRIAYITPEERAMLLGSIEEKYNKLYENHKCRVFDGNDSINIEFEELNPLNIDSYRKSSTSGDKAWIGEPIKIGNSVSIEFIQGLNNLIILSREKSQLKNILSSILISIAYQKSGIPDKCIYLLDYYNCLDEDNDGIKYLISNSSIIESTLSNTSKNIINSVYEILEKRRQDDCSYYKPIYLIINGINRSRELLITESDIGGGLIRESRRTAKLNNLQEIIKVGGDYNIFVVATCDSYHSITNISDKIGFKLLNYMNWRIAFNMNGRDGEKFVKTSDTELLNDNSGILYEEILGDTTKFITYSQPNIQWINNRLFK